MSYAFILGATLLAVATQHFVKIAYVYNSYGNEHHNHYPGPCRHVKGLETDGAEDMTLLPSGQLIISSGLSFESAARLPGAMYIIDTNKGEETASMLTIQGWPEDTVFNPHGVHHWVKKDGSILIFLVTHGPESVYVFSFDGNLTLSYVKHYTHDKLFRNLNSVFPTGEDSFYVSNIMNSKGGSFWPAVGEFLLFFPLGYIIHVKGDTYTSVANGLHYPNGLDGNDKFLYTVVKDSVLIYHRHTDGNLTLAKTIPNPIGSQDNIKLHKNGDLWIGCQAIWKEIMEHLQHKTARSSSTVLRVMDPHGDPRIEEVLHDDGGFIMAATVAINTKGKLYVGTVKHKMAVCDVKYLMGQP